MARSLQYDIEPPGFRDKNTDFDPYDLRTNTNNINAYQHSNEPSLSQKNYRKNSITVNTEQE